MRRAIAGLLLSCVALAPLAARAQNAGNREAARAAFDEATRQFEHRNYQLALEGFQRSYDLMEGQPTQIIILYNVARSHEELGNLREALEAFERYAANAPADAPYLEETGDRVRDLRARIAASSDGGEALLFSGIAIAGVGIAELVASIITGALALDGEARLESMCEGMLCAPSAQGLIDETRTLGLATDVLWISGAVLAAVGATLLALGLTKGANATTTAVACGPNGCYGVVWGTF
jgi:tetratricopeptide (TPR) repeat protein